MTRRHPNFVVRHAPLIAMLLVVLLFVVGFAVIEFAGT